MYCLLHHSIDDIRDAKTSLASTGLRNPHTADQAWLEAAFEQLAAKGIARDDILHVAQSLHHDHVPAKRIGMPSVWINRRVVRGGGWGATVPPPEDVKPDMEFPSMAAFADATERATAR